MAKHLLNPVDPDKIAARAILGVTATGVRMRIRTKSGGLGLRRRDLRSTSLWMYNTPMTFNVPVRCDPARTPQGQLLCGVRAHIRTIDTPPRRYATSSPLANSAGELRRFETHLEQGAMEAPPISQTLQATAYILAFHE